NNRHAFWRERVETRRGPRARRDRLGGEVMAKLLTTVVDAADAMIRRLGGQRLCSFCLKWAKTPHKSGELYFCGRIHASTFYTKQQEAMKKAIEKKKSEEGG